MDIYENILAAIDNENELFCQNELAELDGIGEKIEEENKKLDKIMRSRRTTRFDVENKRGEIQNLQNKLKDARDKYFDKKLESVEIRDEKIGNLETLWEVFLKNK